MPKEKTLKTEIIQVGSRLYKSGLAQVKSGNISARLGKNHILITATGTCLGSLKPADIVKINLNTGETKGDKPPSSELPLHSLIYKHFPHSTVIHCHPPLINGYFAVNPALKVLTLETKLYLKCVPVVKQSTVTVTRPGPVISALKRSSLVVLKNHGVVVIAYDFTQGLLLIESLEQAVRVAACARLFNKRRFDKLDKALKLYLSHGHNH
ncbi:MAG: hypothetical protein A3K83_04325 [Omnitrophica WOR_2 bacterium RBG_13_44_8b]|nr:MAG: hypothetical protein A3K83_04325 [Omnitrophica WOR_2 bacterium RBG_13_44_8b]